MSEEKFQELFGVKRATFELLQEVLERRYAEELKNGGRKGKTSVLDRLVFMLEYYRGYMTMERLAFNYGVAKSTVCNAICWAEETLVRYGNLPLPKKRKLPPCNVEIAIDVTEVDIERPKKKTGQILLRKKGAAYAESPDCRGKIKQRCSLRGFCRGEQA